MYAQTTNTAAVRANAEESVWTAIPANGQAIVKLGHGETLFHDGDDADFVYEVVDGLMTSYSILADGRRQILGFLFPGDILGLSNDGFYHNSCCAVGPASVRAIPRSMLMRVSRDRPEIGAKLLECATKQLIGMQNHFVLLGRKSAQEKVASFLLVLARRHAGDKEQTVSFRLPMSRSEIADYLGMTIETVSRTLTKLRINGVIELPQTSTVNVRSLSRLERLAGDEDMGF